MNQNLSRNRRNATLLLILAQLVIIAAAVTLGRITYHHTAGHGYWTITFAAGVSLATILALGSLNETFLGPVIDRLRNTRTEADK